MDLIQIKISLNEIFVYGWMIKKYQNELTVYNYNHNKNKITMADLAQKDQNVNQFNKFLENNTDFLQERYDQYFKKASITLKEFNKQAAIRYIYDVFSFSKYETDQKMNTTLQKSLLKNIEDFLAGLSKKKMAFNNKTAVELLKYCIENNEMFAVKYDKKDKKIKTQEHKNQSSYSQKQQRQSKNEQKQRIQEQEVEKQMPEGKEKDDQQNKSEQFQQNKDQNIVNQFQQVKKEQNQKTTDPELIKKNLKAMFQFYCKQQQNVGAHTTFDRISYECKTMTLGKFLAFGISTQIMNEKIDRNLLMRKFKLTAQGKKQIQFDQFYQIVQTLAGINEALIPKLGVDQKNNFKNKLKQRLMPFSTKDSTSRQVKSYHLFVPKLTGHSGKLSDALYEQIQQRKQAKMLGSVNQMKPLQSQQIKNVKTPYNNNRYQNYSKLQPKQSQIITSPTQITSSHVRDFEDDLSFLGKMINEEQNDQQWLKQYKLPPNYKKQTVNLPKLTSRKDNIVPNLKKRVQELERTQTRQTVHLEKRQFMGKSKQRQRNSKSVLN